MFRPDPALPAGQYKTYAIKTVPGVHTRRATCAEVECPAWANGWVSRVDERTDLGQGQAYYIRTQSGRGFTERRTPEGLTEFTFEAGQTCFASGSHEIQERPSLFLVRDGDWRGNPRGTAPYVHATPDNWVDDFANHQIGLAEQIEKG